jgi:hypothetical protein
LQESHPPAFTEVVEMVESCQAMKHLRGACHRKASNFGGETMKGFMAQLIPVHIKSNLSRRSIYLTILAVGALFCLLTLASCSLDSGLMNFYFDDEIETSNTYLTIEWDPNAEPDLAGYKIYYGYSSGVYVYVIDVGNSTNHTITSLEPGQMYFFTATAYNIAGYESDYAEEISYTVPDDIPSI